MAKTQPQPAEPADQTAGEPPDDEPTIPPELRPAPSVADGEPSGESPDPEAPLGRHPDGSPRKRRKRSDAGKSKGTAKVAADGSVKPPTVAQKAAMGFALIYGGIGMGLARLGIAPAAGMVMVGLADEAGPELADWARKRAPKLHKFAAGLAEVGGPGRFVGVPVAAEATARAPMLREPLSQPLELVVGSDGMDALEGTWARYDEARAQAAAEAEAMAAAEHADENGGAVADA